MRPPELPSLLPAISTRGFRVLDGIRFPCEVVALEAAAKSLSVRFLDDDTIEDGVDLDEFEWENHAQTVIEGHAATKTATSNYRQHWLCHHMRDALLICHVAHFLDHFQWAKSLMKVCHPWRKALFEPTQWRKYQMARTATATYPNQVDRAPYVAALPPPPRMMHRHHLLDLRLASGVCVSDVVTTLVLNDTNVTDDQVLALAHKCTHVEHIQLRRCPNVSFMLVYELLRLSRERQVTATGNQTLKTLDVWLCRGISPSYVAQLSTSRGVTDNKRRHTLDIRGPGFFFIDVPVEQVYRPLQKLSTEQPLGFKTTRLEILWLPKDTLLAILMDDNDANGCRTVWQSLQRHAPLIEAFSLPIIPLVRLDTLLLSPVPSHVSPPHSVCLGLPSTPQDLLQLLHEYEVPSTVGPLLAIVAAMASHQRHSTDADSKPIDPMEEQATRVFAMLRHTTEQLQSQVHHLEKQVAAMAIAKQKAEDEYKKAQRDLHRVAVEADRAVLCLATSSSSSSPPLPSSPSKSISTAPLPPPPENGIITTKPDDVLLPLLPSPSMITALAQSLDRQYVALLDGFVGSTLSTQLRNDVEQMYKDSRAIDDDNRGDLLLPPAAPMTVAAAQFDLGELAGGNTGRNLRYQMAHVRGDYMLWLDEHDSFCPVSVQQVLRQLDRLVLERLCLQSHELSMCALMRKKAMVTCYPGKSQAKYTRHCDNPNQNGRKLTAILYLNANWQVATHGGELLLHVPVVLPPGSQGEEQQQGDTSTRVAPLMDRLVLFFSDPRVPHEVLSCRDATRDRFALTVWYFDYDEFMHAQVFGAAATVNQKHGGQEQDKEQVERRRIEKEIERLQQQQ